MVENNCETCWWKLVCKKTKKACCILQGVDMRWVDSPNNKKKQTKKEADDELDKFELLFTSYNVPDETLTKDAQELKARIVALVTKLYKKLNRYCV